MVKFRKDWLSPAARAFFKAAGKRGGKLGGKARARKLTAAQRSAIAKAAAAARWWKKIGPTKRRKGRKRKETR